MQRTVLSFCCDLPIKQKVCPALFQAVTAQIEYGVIWQELEKRVFALWPYVREHLLQLEFRGTQPKYQLVFFK